MDSLPHDFQRSGTLIASLNTRAIQTAQELDVIILQLLQDQEYDPVDTSTDINNNVRSLCDSEAGDFDDSIHDPLPKLLSLYSDLRFLRSNSYAESVRMNSAIESSQLHIASEIHRIQTYLKSDAAKDLIRRIEYLHKDDTSDITKDLEKLKIYNKSPLQAFQILNEAEQSSEEEDQSDEELTNLIDKRLHDMESSDDDDFSEFFKFLDDEEPNTKKEEEKNEKEERSKKTSETLNIKTEAQSNNEENPEKEHGNYTRSFQLLNLPRGRRRTRASQAAAKDFEVDVKFIESEENQAFLKRQVAVIEKLLDLGVTKEPDNLLPRLMEKGNIPAEDALSQLEKVKVIEDLFFLGLIGFDKEKPPKPSNLPAHFTKAFKGRGKTSKAKTKDTPVEQELLNESSQELPRQKMDKPSDEQLQESSHEQENKDHSLINTTQQFRDKESDDLPEVSDSSIKNSPTTLNQTTTNFDAFNSPIQSQHNQGLIDVTNQPENMELQLHDFSQGIFFILTLYILFNH